MSKLFPTYEIGSLPKLNARVKAVRGQPVTDEDIKEVQYLARRFSVEPYEVIDILEKQRREQKKLTPEKKAALIDFNALLYIKLQEALGLDFVYDGEARRTEMYQHVATRIDGFEKLPEMIRSRGPDSYRMHVCVASPKLKDGAIGDLVVGEFDFARQHAILPIKIPINDPYMVAIMSDNRYYLELIRPQYSDEPNRLRYEAKRAFTLALARDVIRPQVEAVVERGAKWIQLDAPAATLDIEHIPIMIEGVNAVVEGIENVKFSLHVCYPRRVTLTDKSGYELLFPAILDLNPRVNHLSLELANADQYKEDLAVFAEYRSQRPFELGIGVVDITLEQQQKGKMETPETVKTRILRAAEILGDPGLVYAAPDCGMRQLQMDRCLKLYETLEEGAELARRG